MEYLHHWLVHKVCSWKNKKESFIIPVSERATVTITKKSLIKYLVAWRAWNWRNELARCVWTI